MAVTEQVRASGKDQSRNETSIKHYRTEGERWSDRGRRNVVWVEHVLYICEAYGHM